MKHSKRERPRQDNNLEPGINKAAQIIPVFMHKLQNTIKNNKIPEPVICSVCNVKSVFVVDRYVPYINTSTKVCEKCQNIQKIKLYRKNNIDDCMLSAGIPQKYISSYFKEYSSFYKEYLKKPYSFFMFGLGKDILIFFVSLVRELLLSGED